jgi:hypothetical protein
MAFGDSGSTMRIIMSGASQQQWANWRLACASHGGGCCIQGCAVSKQPAKRQTLTVANTQPGNPRPDLAAALLLPEQHTRDCATCRPTLPICCSSMQHFHFHTIPISPGLYRPPRTLPIAITNRSRYRRPVQPRLPRQPTLHSLKCLSPVPFFAHTNQYHQHHPNTTTTSHPEHHIVHSRLHQK